MGLCNSKPSVAGSPARYTTHTSEQATPSRSESPSSSTNALRDALPSPPRSAPRTKRESLASVARQVYEGSVLFHGTSGSNRDALRSRGFSVANKTHGATEGVRRQSVLFETPSQELTSNSRLYNYFTSDKDAAYNFALMADPCDTAIVRTIGIRNNIPIEADTDTTYNSNLRTVNDVPAKYVLGSKRSEPGLNAKVFKQEMKTAGYNVSTAEAGRLLREVQSDSDQDEAF
ncbi:type III effector [Pantoea stewartii]|uniref:type III effector n=1 Tax=Pantoea stewartii TaxID=66269 RepID=UPI00345B4C70